MSYILPEKFTKPYDSTLTEKRIYDLWEQSGYFNPDNLPNSAERKPWCTIMPPPNANGRLHAGHGLDMTLKDIATRFKRMQGYKALFLPGADHAGFETQIVYEKKLSKEGRSRFQMTPEELYAEILDFTLENKQYMEADIRRLGASCDWSREKFTLDPEIVDQVHATFIKMYHDGLVYRGKRSVNWCSKHQTSLSDVETEFIDTKGIFYYFQFGPFVIGTARPETKFADKYVVVHPDDERYAAYSHMQTLEAEWINGPITLTVIKDVVANKDMGTGAMTITPWHSVIDFELAQKYNLDMEQIIGENGKLLPVAGEFAGMKIEEARPKIVEKLQEKNLLVKIDENYTHALKTCYKCATAIEPQIKDQWFVKMEPLAKLALEAVDSGKVTFLTEQFEKTFRHWMTHTIDWNISRQIVWGITIPAWFKNKGQEHEEVHVGVNPPADATGWEKEQDTFDTWFSSGQWPVVTLGFPDNPDFAEYYPTNLMQTGRDLIFKWIPRMIMFGMYVTGKHPFDMVYLHGMINDEHNQKMSKSKGNVMSPIDLADEFGTDALRMALVVGNTPGNDMALSKDKIKAYKKFANKLWNISRFVLSRADEDYPLTTATILPEHQKHLDLFTETRSELTHLMEEYKFYLAAEKIYHYVWHELADSVIEKLKSDLESEDHAVQDSAQRTLMHLLYGSLVHLHPFMPFITEEIWQEFPTSWHKHHGDILMIASWSTHL